ncbi:hypothetical protein OYT1_ch1004 [Ferriphaselus amnicola]|uniref:Barstar (barnase inhibitor) domain-containing protein n=1 Tax=Ferriphaselus amnicola TaxID=1188319 RepID=A0A2Z6GBG3_9PROT|nr:barstar family protein [Ferriphaselus amnicola]BBE50565.1 hypothetical protein OYT1_ch1004 [Ferriphaselus amnicola]
MVRSTVNPSQPPLDLEGGRSGSARFDVEVSGLDKSAFIATIAHAVGVPASFGDNWDALADGLQDLSWCQASSYELVLRGSAALSEAEWAISREIFSDTEQFWQAQGKSFRVKVES